MKPKNYFFQTMKFLMMSFIVLILISNVSAQDIYKVEKASVTISGTSTLHDWQMLSDAFACTTQFELADNKIVGVKSLLLSVPVQSLKSGKGAMDKNAYAALKADQYKQIQYSIVSAKIVGNKILCIGNLTIAGVSKPMEIESSCTLSADNTIMCKTSKRFKMTEFKVEPPSFMFGSVTTGDEITVAFDITFKKS